MYCRKCGIELDEGARFCENCGTPVAHEELDNRPIGKPSSGPAKSMDPKTKRNIIIAAIIALIVIGGGVTALVISLSDGYSAECRDKLETAQQYVEDGNLTDAEAAYLDIIRLEPDKPTAYIELAEKVYVPQHRYNDAENILHDGQENTGGSHEIDDSLERVDQERKEAGKWMTAYRNILEQNEKGIRKFESILEGEDYGADSKDNRNGTALCDFDGDGIPELMFFTSDEYTGYSELHIFTYADGKASELKYNWTTQTVFDYDGGVYEPARMGAFYEVGALYYVIYKEKGEKGFTVHSMLYEDVINSEATSRYSMNASKELECTDMFSHEIVYDYNDDSEKISYYSNYESCSSEQYKKQLDSSASNMEKVLFRFLPDEEYDYLIEEGFDPAVWKATEGKDTSIAYDDMIKELNASGNADAPETKTGAAEMSIEEVNEAITGDWVPETTSDVYEWYSFKYYEEGADHSTFLVTKEYVGTDGGASSAVEVSKQGTTVTYTAIPGTPLAAGGELGTVTVDISSIDKGVLIIGGEKYIRKTGDN